MDQITSHDFEELRQEVASLRQDVQSLLNLWQQGKGVLNFMKYLAATAAAVAAVFAIFKH